ncbi:hypothetical protein XELAEV_18004548mg [Xenopus laevis]|uniref:Uncharacterized protein n=1 Tax=Xenopus laevis TaxID=8355 RepID=A0A974BR90_XENLA|nr:hypothetical protein XELAEV_18004548mg [Xenopus laevis]
MRLINASPFSTDPSYFTHNSVLIALPPSLQSHKHTNHTQLSFAAMHSLYIFIMCFNMGFYINNIFIV